MPIYDGVVTVAEDDIPVIVELNDDVVRLSASGTEIGEWPKSECEIRHVGDSTYSIQAEDETLSFVPSEPSLFAAAVNGDGPGAARVPSSEEAEPAPGVGAPETETPTAPPPKPVTVGLFYALCLLTAGLGIWSVISLVF